MRILFWSLIAVAATALIFHWTHDIPVDLFWFPMFLSMFFLGLKLKRERDDAERRAGEMARVRSYFDQLVRDIQARSSDKIAKSWAKHSFDNMDDKLKVELCHSTIRDLIGRGWEKDAIYNTVVEYLYPKTWDNYGEKPSPRHVKGLIDKMVREHKDQKKALSVIRKVVLEGKNIHTETGIPIPGEVQDPHTIKKGVLKIDEHKTQVIEQLQHEKHNLLEKIRGQNE